MRYYDNNISKQVIRKSDYYSLSQETKIQAQDEIIEITKETKNSLYGISWQGRWKYNKSTDTWYLYKYNKWWQENGTYILINK